jgi:hypothetical protein
MSSRAWKIVAAIICLLTVERVCAEPQPIARFGRWTLGKEGNDKAFLSPTDGLFFVACSDSFMIYSIGLPIKDRTAVRWDATLKSSYFHFTAWADAGMPADFKFPVGDGDQFAIAMATLNPDISTQDKDLWLMLKSARVKFSFSTLSGTTSIDATDLPSAIYRFEQECAKIFIANGQKKLREPIPLQWLNR